MDFDKLEIGNWLENTGNLEWSQTSPRARKFGIPGTGCTVAVNYIKMGPEISEEDRAKIAARPMHKHEYEQIMLIMEGGGDVVIEGKHFPMHDGSYCVIPPNVMHKYDASKSPKSIINIDIFVPSRDEFIHRKEKKD